jgi:hypothetical protein
MGIIISAVIAGVSAAAIGDLTHSAVAGFASLVAQAAWFITVAVRRRRREAAA